MLIRDLIEKLHGVLAYLFIFRLCLRLYPWVLDVGCGRGSEVTRIFTKSHSFNTSRLIVGLDLYLPSVREAKLRLIYDQVIIADARFLPFRRKSFDVILSLELIEHLNRKEGEELLRLLEQIARHQIVITTPNGSVYQGAVEGNIWQVHRSAWRKQDFVLRGYSVLGLGGFCNVKRDVSSLGFFRCFWYLANVGTYFLQPLYSKVPRLAPKLVCIKDYICNSHL